MTRSSEYALRAVIFLAQHRDRWPLPGHAIAKGTGIPAKYLQKILGDLTRTGVLTSSPGRTGGFRIARADGDVPLLEVLTPFERSNASRCPFGNTICSDKNPCRAHHEWSKVTEAEQRFLSDTCVADVAAPAKPARRPTARKKTR